MSANGRYDLSSEHVRQMDTITVQQRLKDLQRSSNDYHDQKQSPLFSSILPEIRNQIFALAVTQYDDLSAAYHLDTSYRRPGNLAPKKTCTALLSTCKRAYNEAWFMPWANQELVFYFTTRETRPAEITGPLVTTTRGPVDYVLSSQLVQIYESRGRVDEIGHVQLYVDVWVLEVLDRAFATFFCDVPLFYPQRMAITIRHTDWADWKVNRPLRICGTWIKEARLPNSVREVCVEFESTTRRQYQVDTLSDKAAALWYFERKDGALLVADAEEKTVMRWTGSSIWDQQRWHRHESRPFEIDYYVRTISFKIRSGWSKEDVADHDQSATLQFIHGHDARND